MTARYHFLKSVFTNTAWRRRLSIYHRRNCL